MLAFTRGDITGDPVKEDDVIAQIETDKVTIDVKYTSKEPGVLKKVMIAAGDVVQVGQMVATVEQGKVTPSAADLMPKSETPAPVAAPKPTSPPPPPPAARSQVRRGILLPQFDQPQNDVVKEKTIV